MQSLVQKKLPAEAIRSITALLALTILTMVSGQTSARTDNTKASHITQLEARLHELARNHSGRVGLCVIDEHGHTSSVNGDQPFSLQSVMKVLVGAAVMRAVDQGKMRLDDSVTIKREDLSVGIQPLAEIVEKEGKFETTMGDLVHRAVTQSDSAATDVLIAKLGGVKSVQQLLLDAGVKGIRIDRTERELQTETAGLHWQPEYVYPERLEAAIKRVSAADRKAAFEAYLRDPRDTATPQGMAVFLSMLAQGKLLSPESTRHFLEVMSKTATFPDRLRAGAAEGWKVGHKTGTSQTVDGVNGVTNDVGILATPDGRLIAIAAFVAESTGSAAERAAVIADAARAVVAGYR